MDFGLNHKVFHGRIGASILFSVDNLIERKVGSGSFAIIELLGEGNGGTLTFL